MYRERKCRSHRHQLHCLHLVDSRVYVRNSINIYSYSISMFPLYWCVCVCVLMLLLVLFNRHQSSPMSATMNIRHLALHANMPHISTISWLHDIHIVMQRVIAVWVKLRAEMESKDITFQMVDGGETVAIGHRAYTSGPFNILAMRCMSKQLIALCAIAMSRLGYMERYHPRGGEGFTGDQRCACQVGGAMGACFWRMK